MSDSAYICRIRTDIPAGALQIVDLSPNTSLRNPTIQPSGQTGYLGPIADNDTVATTTSGGNDVTVAAYSGIAAYLLANVEKGGLAAGTSALTDSDANTIAAAIEAIRDAGNPLTLAVVNTTISATAANSELTNAGGSASTGSLLELLKIMSGATWTMPAGSITETPTGTFNPASKGSFSGTYRQIYMSGDLNISCGEGNLAAFASSSFSYGGTTGAALVVYKYDGSVLT